MCLAFLALDEELATPILAFNRDEDFSRPTQPAHEWSSLPLGAPRIIGGRDAQRGGSWLVASSKGRCAYVTNVGPRYAGPEPIRPAQDYPLSRGALTAEFVTGDAPPFDYLSAVASRAGDYAPFNLVVVDARRRTAAYFSNRANAPPLPLGPGVHGLSNAFLETPWPKLAMGKARIAAAAAAHPLGDLPATLLPPGPTPAEARLHAALLDTMADTSPPPRPEADGPGPREDEDEPAFRPAMVLSRDGQHGTRSSTALSLAAGRWVLSERWRESAAGAWHEHCLVLPLQAD